MSPVGDLSPSELNKVPVDYKAPRVASWDEVCVVQHFFIIS